MGEKKSIVLTGGIVGIIGVALVMPGNPANMGFCIACFLRDIAGALGLQRAGVVQYMRPEIMGLVLGSFLIAISKKEFNVRGGSSPIIRFTLGVMVMIGALMFLGCPLRQLILAGEGNTDSVVTVLGLLFGGAIAHNFSLASSSKGPTINGQMAVIICIFILLLVSYFNSEFLNKKVEVK
ncbi:MAG: hypothetical protein WBG30_07540 [Psychrilyobacter sp.]|uniref:hypothetical protein n=1 Tax=Psychrilyobacter sp. TaxID=2586924 RepID=UPI003C74AF38